MNQQIRSLFPVTEKYIYFNHAEVSPLSIRVRDAMTGLIEDVTHNGSRNFFGWCDVYEKARRDIAKLAGAHSHEIAFMRNTSDAISTLANGIDWRDGDNVVTTAIEFPANIYPWMRISEERGVKIKMAPERDGRIDIDELLSLVDERTRVLTISWVQFSNGFRAPLARIGKFCRERGIFFFVDAIQGLGGLKLDVERDYVDAFAGDGHKYTLGPEGVAILYISDRILDDIKPTVVGWMSVKDFGHHLDYDLTYRDGALRFECGTLNTVGIYGLGASVDLILEVGPEQIEKHILGLTDYLVERLQASGYEVISSRREGESSGIVNCRHEKYSPKDLYRILLSKNIVTAPRVGRLRFSPHFYNTREEVDAIINALPK